MYPALRLSRIRNPRATLWSIALLVVALGLFGTWASVSHAGATARSAEFAGNDRLATLTDALHAAVAIE